MLRFYDIFKDLDEMRRDMEGSNMWRKPYSRASFLPSINARHYPMINLYEDSDNLYLEALAPGIDPETLEIFFTRNAISISGEKVTVSKNISPEAFHRSERGAGKFNRTIELSTPVDESKVKADYRNGLLLISMPRTEEAKPRKIAVNLSQG